MAAVKKGDTVCYSASSRLARLAEQIDQQASVVENGVVQGVLGNVSEEMRMMSRRLETFRRNEYGQPEGPSDPQ